MCNTLFNNLNCMCMCVYINTLWSMIVNQQKRKFKKEEKGEKEFQMMCVLYIESFFLFKSMFNIIFLATKPLSSSYKILTFFL